MAGITGTLLGAGASILGARSASRGASRDRRLQQQAADRLAQVSFSPADIGFGDAGFRGGQFNLGQFGQLNDIFNALSTSGTQLGLGQVLGSMEGFDERTLNRELQAGDLATGAFDFARALQGDGFQRGLQNQLFGRAGELAGQTDFSGLRNENLDLLRQLASPFEERAFSGLQENLFSTGRIGSSGGALQTEAFARGLGEADLNRQLSSIGLAQQQQAQNANLANLFGNLGMGMAGMESDLLGQAFQRFGATTGLAQDLNQQRFGRGIDLFNLGGAGLSGQNDILNMLLSLGTFGANLGATKANVALGAAGGAANAVNQFGPSGSDIRAGFLSSLGANLMGPGGLSNLFSGLGQRTSTTQNNPYQFGLGNSSLGSYNPFGSLPTPTYTG